MGKRENFAKIELGALAEIAMTGVAIPMTERDNLEYMLGYIAKALGHEETTGAEIYAKATEFIDPEETEAAGLSCSTIMGTDLVVNVIFRDKGVPLKLDDPDGVLCYVYNFSCEWCSELGYCFFERKENSRDYHRIG